MLNQSIKLNSKNIKIFFKIIYTKMSTTMTTLSYDQFRNDITIFTESLEADWYIYFVIYFVNRLRPMLQWKAIRTPLLGLVLQKPVKVIYRVIIAFSSIFIDMKGHIRYCINSFSIAMSKFGQFVLNTHLTSWGG